MDTQTVLDIIKIIYAKQKHIKDHLKTIPDYNQDEIQYFHGMLDGYFDLNQHLHSFIEGQLNAAENQTEQ